MYYVFLCIIIYYYVLSHNIMYYYELLGIIIQNNARKIKNIDYKSHQIDQK